MMRFQRILLLSIFLLLCGCASYPEHELAVREDSGGCASLEEEARKRGIEIGEWPALNWWTGFEDPVLTYLVETGLESSPNLKKAEENLKAAAQAAGRAKSALFPQLSFAADTNWQHLSDNGFFRGFAPLIPTIVNDMQYGFNFSYEFDFWGKYRNLFEASLGRVIASVADKMQADLILTTSIAYTYSELQMLLRKRELLARIQENRQKIENIRQRRQRHAIDPAATILTSKTTQLDAAAPLIEIDNQIEVHFNKIKALTGLGQDAELQIPYHPIAPLQVTVPECLSLNLIARRPDLIAQKWRVEAAGKDIGASKADFYPNINLTGFVGIESVFTSKLFRLSSFSANANPALNLPIFTAGRLRAQMLEKVADFNMAVYDYNQLILQAAQAVADNISDMDRFQKEIDLRQNSLLIAQQQEQLAEHRFMNALDDRIELLDRQNSVFQAEITLVELEYGKLLSSIDLIRNLGGGFYDCR